MSTNNWRLRFTGQSAPSTKLHVQYVRQQSDVHLSLATPNRWLFLAFVPPPRNKNLTSLSRCDVFISLIRLLTEFGCCSEGWWPTVRLKLCAIMALTTHNRLLVDTACMLTCKSVPVSSLVATLLIMDAKFFPSDCFYSSQCSSYLATSVVWDFCIERKSYRPRRRKARS